MTSAIELHHIYGDMYRAKRASVWRTAMIIQELEDELLNQRLVEQQLQRLESLERTRHRVEAELRYAQLLGRRLRSLAQADSQLRPPPEENPGKPIAQAQLVLRTHSEAMRTQIRTIDDELDRLEHEVEQAFNPFWGPLLKAAAENSRFGQQVEDFACVYTSRVSNFLQYAPFQHFRSPRDHLPHERVY